MIKHRNKDIIYTMLPRLVESYFIVLRWYPVMLIVEDICGRWLGLCRYEDDDIVLTRRRARPSVSQDVCFRRPLSYRSRI